MNTFQKASFIAAITLSAAGSAFASMTPQEHNRQITRGNGAAEVGSVEFRSVSGAKATPHTVIRHTRVASERKALRNEVNTSRAVKVTKMAKREQTPFQKNRNS